jgi:hypothetical protein
VQKYTKAYKYKAYLGDLTIAKIEQAIKIIKNANIPIISLPKTYTRARKIESCKTLHNPLISHSKLKPKAQSIFA